MILEYPKRNQAQILISMSTDTRMLSHLIHECCLLSHTLFCTHQGHLVDELNCANRTFVIVYSSIIASTIALPNTHFHSLSYHIHLLGVWN